MSAIPEHEHTQPTGTESTAPAAAGEPAGSAEPAPRHLGVVTEPAEAGEAGEQGAGSTGGWSAPRPEPAAAQSRGPVAGLVEKAQQTEVWSTPRPALRDIWRHARWGEPTAGNAAARVAASAYAVGAVGLHAWLHLTGWLIERPSRAAVTAAVLGVVALTSWGRAALTALLFPLHLSLDLLTDY